MNSNTGHKFRRIRPRPGEWLVWGKVSGTDGVGIPNLRVNVYDKDLLFDDKLGETITDSDGEFYVRYHESNFKDLFESQPDIYVKVINKKGRILYTSERVVRWRSGRVEYFDIEIR